MSDGLSIATQIARLGMMCIISKERIAFSTQVEGTPGEVFAALPIALQFRCKHVLNEPILTYGHSWPSTPDCSFTIWDCQSEKKRGTARGGQYAMRRMVFALGAEYAATGISLMTLTDRVYSDGVIPHGRNYFLLMLVTGTIPLHFGRYGTQHSK
jgi:hypothetical protein